MKSIVSMITAIFCFAVAGHAQSPERPSIGFRAGINFQNLNGKNAAGDKLENDVLVGFNAGVVAEVPIAPDFYVQPGILYTIKGANFDPSFGDPDARIKVSYVEVPVNLLYKPMLGTGRLLIGFGPYLGIATSGKLKLSNSSSDVKFDNDITLAQAATNVYLKRIDAGANVLFGYEFTRHLSAQINAQLGLSNLEPKLDGKKNGTTKNTGFGLSLGYRL